MTRATPPRPWPRSSPSTGKGDPALDAAYGEALVLANGGAVPPEAEDAFTAALAVDPHNAPARFYLGLAKASRTTTGPAPSRCGRACWPTCRPIAPLHQMLVDRIAMLTSQGWQAGRRARSARHGGHAGGAAEGRSQ